MKKCIIILSAILLAVVSFAQTTASSYKGGTETAIMGKNEVCNDLVLVVKSNGTKRNVNLDGYAVLNYKDVSISATLELDGEGNIISSENISVTGAPAKIKSIKGKMTASEADIVLDGKAGGLFGFKVHYKAAAE